VGGAFVSDETFERNGGGGQEKEVGDERASRLSAGFAKEGKGCGSSALQTRGRKIGKRQERGTQNGEGKRGRGSSGNLAKSVCPLTSAKAVLLRRQDVLASPSAKLSGMTGITVIWVSAEMRST